MRRHFPVSFAVSSIVVLAFLRVFRINDDSYHLAWGFSILVVPSSSSRRLRTIIPKSSPIGLEGTLCLSKQQPFSAQEEEEESSRHNNNDEDKGTLRRNSLGINLGQDYSLALNETDRESLRSEIKAMIDHRISKGILDLQQLHDRWERQVEGDLESLEQAMTLNSIHESKRFATQLDSIVGKFWNQTAVSRQKTRDLFYLDEMERAQKAKEEAAKRKAKRRHGTSSSSSVDGTSFPQQSWKKTNDAWDDWDQDDW